MRAHDAWKCDGKENTICVYMLLFNFGYLEPPIVFNSTKRKGTMYNIVYISFTTFNFLAFKYSHFFTFRLQDI